MRMFLPLVLVLLAAVPAAGQRIQMKVVGPPHRCGALCCVRHDRWVDTWAVFHPTRLSIVGAPPEATLPDTWVVKRLNACCGGDRYDGYGVDGAELTPTGAVDGYRARPDSPRIPPVLADYWPDRLLPDWFIDGRYFYFVRIDPPAGNPDQPSSWWISPDGRRWDLLEAAALVDDDQRRQQLGGPPQLPLPPAALVY